MALIRLNFLQHLKIYFFLKTQQRHLYFGLPIYCCLHPKTFRHYSTFYKVCQFLISFVLVRLLLSVRTNFGGNVSVGIIFIICQRNNSNKRNKIMKNHCKLLVDIQYIGIARRCQIILIKKFEKTSSKVRSMCKLFELRNNKKASISTILSSL